MENNLIMGDTNRFKRIVNSLTSFKYFESVHRYELWNKGKQIE